MKGLRSQGLHPNFPSPFMTINRNFLKVMWVIVITVLQFMRAIISLKKRGATLMLSFSSCEAKKGSRDLDFSNMKKLCTYFKMGTFLATFEQFSVQFCKKMDVHEPDNGMLRFMAN